MHYVTVKGILSNNNGMNLYRGCTHGCIYCDSRSTCYQINHEFTDVEIKENALTLLESALSKKKHKCMIGFGSMSDPYIPLELKLNYTKRALELIYQYGFGVNIQTKSTSLLRDLDLLKKINERSKVVVNVTMTTYNDDLCKVIEPNVSVTSERFKMLKMLSDNNIKTIVWLCPILPFINDTKENILGLLNYCKESRVYGVICFGMGLTLREGNREYFYEKLDESFPQLKQKYVENYKNSYGVMSRNNTELMRLFHKFCEENNIVHDNDVLFNYMYEFDDKKEQLNLF